MLEAISPSERRYWVLKFGSVAEVQESQDNQVGAITVEISLPDGTKGVFFDDTGIDERRAFVRKSIKLKTTIISGRRVFRTFTDNLSLGGVALMTAPPRDYAHPDLKVIFESNDGTQLMIQIAFVDSNQKRLRFLNMSDEVRSQLLKWLETPAAGSQAA